MPNDYPYPDVASLRRALSSGDADQRSTAYQELFQADVDPSAVMSDDPPEEALVEAGVIPPDDTRTTRDDYLQQMVSLLEDIAENTGGGS